MNKVKYRSISLLVGCLLFLTLTVGHGCKTEPEVATEPTTEPEPEPDLEVPSIQPPANSQYIDVNVSSETIMALDYYAAGCGGSGESGACRHNYVVALGFEQNGKLARLDGTALYENFVEYFASGPLRTEIIRDDTLGLKEPTEPEPEATEPERVWLPPNSLECGLFYFNDTLIIHNLSARDVYIIRLSSPFGTTPAELTMTPEVIEEAQASCSLVGPQNEDLRYRNDDNVTNLSP